MKKLVLVAFVSAALSVCAIAQQNTNSTEHQQKIKIAEQIMALAGPASELERNGNGIGPTTRANLTAQIKRSNPQLSQVQLDRAADLHMQIFTKSANRFSSEVLPLILDKTSKAYAEKFSLNELTLIYQYHSSNLGLKARDFSLNEMPELMKPLLTATQKIGAEESDALVRIRQQLVLEGIFLK